MVRRTRRSGKGRQLGHAAQSAEIPARVPAPDGRRQNNGPEHAYVLGQARFGVWTDDDSLRLGYFTLQAGGLLPYVYYYQCPTGEIRPGTANTCGAVPPFGGVDWTVQGPACFERRCDPDAVIEPTRTLATAGW